MAIVKKSWVKPAVRTLTGNEVAAVAERHLSVRHMLETTAGRAKATSQA